MFDGTGGRESGRRRQQGIGIGSHTGGGGGGGGVEDGERNNNNNNDSKSINKWIRRRRRTRMSHTGISSRAKHLLTTPFQRNKRSPPPQPPGRSAEEEEDPAGKACYLCFMPPKPKPMPMHKPSPPDKQPAADFLRSLIEKNDFYSPDCNVHHHILF